MWFQSFGRTVFLRSFVDFVVRVAFFPFLSWFVLLAALRCLWSVVFRAARREKAKSSQGGPGSARGLWGCFARIFEEFWRALGGKTALEKLKKIFACYLFE